MIAAALLLALSACGGSAPPPVRGAGERGEERVSNGCRIAILGGPGANPSTGLVGWLDTEGAVTRIHAAGSEGPLVASTLAGFDVVIVDWLARTYSPEESHVLLKWVQDGGGLFVLSGHDSGASIDRHASLLAQLGVGFDVARGALDGPAVVLSAGPAREVGATLPFYGGLVVTSAELEPLAVVGSDVVAVGGPVVAGRAVVFGDEWIAFDSEWTGTPAVPRFWAASLAWLSPRCE